MRRLLILATLALAPFGVLAKSDARAQEATATPSPVDQPQITYLGATYVLLPGCLGTGFVVGINQTPVGQTDKILIAIPFGGGVTVLPPRDVAATGDLADKQLNDALCVNLVAKP